MSVRHESQDQHLNITHVQRPLNIPVELSLLIFSHYLEDVRPVLRRDHSSSIVNIVSVCRKWRDICMASSKLWSRFEIDFSPGSGCDPYTSGNIEILVARWLSLSRNHRLSVRLNYNPPRDTFQRRLDPCPARVIRMLIPHMTRCYELDLSVPSACITPLLELQQTDIAPKGSFTPFNILNSMKLDMRGVWYTDRSFDILGMGVNWAQLVDLKLALDDSAGHLLTLDECVRLLQEASNLQRCSLNATCILEAKDDQEVVLPAVGDLHFTFQGERSVEAERNVAAFLNRVHAPSLKALHIEWLIPSAVDQDITAELARWAPHHSRFLSFLGRIGKSLETLRLSYLPLNEAQLIQCIAVLPRVEDLELRFSLGEESNDPVSEGFLRRLGEARDGLLPRLRSIKLQCYGKAVTLANLDQLIRQRALKRVSVYMGTDVLIMTNNSMTTKWKARGTRVSLSSLTVL